MFLLQCKLISWTKHCVALSPSHPALYSLYIIQIELWSGMYSSLMCWQVLSLLSIHQRWYSAMDSIPFVWKRGTSCSLKRCLCHRNTSSIYLCALSPTCFPQHWTSQKGLRGERRRDRCCIWNVYPSTTDEKCFSGMQYKHNPSTTPAIRMILWP